LRSIYIFHLQTMLFIATWVPDPWGWMPSQKMARPAL
jgi:hypothetical protein